MGDSGVELALILVTLFNSIPNECSRSTVLSCVHISVVVLLVGHPYGLLVRLFHDITVVVCSLNNYWNESLSGMTYGLLTLVWFTVQISSGSSVMVQQTLIIETNCSRTPMINLTIHRDQNIFQY